MDKKLIGIDLGGTSVKIAILSRDGQIEQLWSIPTNIADEGAHIVSDIISSIQETLLANKLTENDILGIGMGSPGQIDYQKGTVTGAYNLGWATEQDIQSRFEKTFGVPFFIDNDANVAALGERWKGAGENARDVIFVTLGTGVEVVSLPMDICYMVKQEVQARSGICLFWEILFLALVGM